MGVSIFRNLSGNIPKGLADFTVLIRNNIDHATAYISVRRAYV